MSFIRIWPPVDVIDERLNTEADYLDPISETYHGRSPEPRGWQEDFVNDLGRPAGGIKDWEYGE